MIATLVAEMLSRPPEGIASRAFSARLRIAASNWFGSSMAGHRSSFTRVSIRAALPSVLASSPAMPRMASATSTLTASRGCLRENASNCAVSREPRSTALVAVSIRRSCRASPAGIRLTQQFQAAEDGRQQVVELMRHSAGELADRLQLLRLPQARLRQLPLRDLHLQAVVAVQQRPGTVRHPNLQRIVQRLQLGPLALQHLGHPVERAAQAGELGRRAARHRGAGRQVPAAPALRRLEQHGRGNTQGSGGPTSSASRMAARRIARSAHSPGPPRDRCPPRRPRRRTRPTRRSPPRPVQVERNPPRGAIRRGCAASRCPGRRRPAMRGPARPARRPRSPGASGTLARIRPPRSRQHQAAIGRALGSGQQGAQPGQVQARHDQPGRRPPSPPNGRAKVSSGMPPAATRVNDPVVKPGHPGTAGSGRRAHPGGSAAGGARRPASPSGRSDGDHAVGRHAVTQTAQQVGAGGIELPHP